MINHLERVYDSLNVRLDCFVRKLRAGQRTHAFQSQVAQVRLSVLQELTQLVTGSHEQIWLTLEQNICQEILPPHQFEKIHIETIVLRWLSVFESPVTSSGGFGCSPVIVDDKRDGLKEDRILGIGVLNFL